MKLRKNPFVSWRAEQQGYVVTNGVDGSVFRLGAGALQALLAADADSAANEDVDCGTAALRELLERDLLVQVDPDSAALCIRNPVRRPLFGGTRLSLAAAGQARVAVLGVPYGQGNTRAGGTEHAPASLRQRSAQLGLDWRQLADPAVLGTSALDWPAAAALPALLGPQCGTPALADLGDVLVYHSEHQQVLFDRIAAMTGLLQAAGATSFLLGGDHSISLPAIAASARQHGPIYLIQFDAHTDTYLSSYDRALAGVRVNHGNFVEAVLRQRLVAGVAQVGVRGLGNLGTRVQDGVQQVRRRLPPGGFAELGIPAGARAYLSVDVDVLDPSCLASTGHAVGGGLQLRELLEGIAEAFQHCQVIGMDLVEFNPGLDANPADTDTCLELALFMASQALCQKVQSQ